jgi:hypothetical protein
VKAGTDLVLRDGKEAVNPETGENLVLKDVEAVELAAYIDDVRYYESKLSEAKQIVGREIHRRMDENLTWTMNVGGFKVTGQSPTTTEWDEDKLEEVLNELVRKRKITAGQRDTVVVKEMVPVRKIVKGKLNALMKVSDEVKAAIVACSSKVEARRSIPTVKRKNEGMAR